MPLLICSRYGKGELLSEVAAHATRSETAERIQLDPWKSTDMDRYMGLIEAEDIILAGVGSTAALMECARGFTDRGYEVTVIEDCSASSDAVEHAKAITELRDMGCRVTGMASEMMRIADAREPFVRDAVARILGIVND